MRVAFNATALLSPLTGIGHYSQEIAQGLVANADVDSIFFWGNHWSEDADAAAAAASEGSIRFRRSLVRKLPKLYDISRYLQQRQFSKHLKRSHCDLYHEPNILAFRSDIPTVITVHDLSWIRFPQTHPLARLRAMEKYFEPGLRQAQHVITDAEYIKNEVVEVFGLPSDCVTSIPLGVDSGFKPLTCGQARPVLNSYQLGYKQYWLALGTLEPRKNLVTAIRAFCNLPETMQRSCPMVLVGMTGWLHESLQKVIDPLKIRGVLRQMGYLPRNSLPSLLSGAKALIYPSLYEGFGLPPLEAMACGTPVIASNSSTLPEVIGDAGLLFDPFDIDGLTNALRELYEDEKRCCDLGQLGRERSLLFSWNRCINSTLDIYRAVTGRA